MPNLSIVSLVRHGHFRRGLAEVVEVVAKIKGYCLAGFYDRNRRIGLLLNEANIPLMDLMSLDGEVVYELTKNPERVVFLVQVTRVSAELLTRLRVDQLKLLLDQEGSPESEKILQDLLMCDRDSCCIM